MALDKHTTGGFTLPGEAGHEELSLSLAKRWGADAIRDSDGTTLSGRLLAAGLSVYSTICVIRNHNDWIKAHPNVRQQCILCTKPKVMTGDRLRVCLLSDFFAEQFQVNDSPEAFGYWQVFDRTANAECPAESWRYEPETQTVVIEGRRWHSYTVSFFAYRVWEEISMYNHTTNHWDAEHLMQIDPIHPQARAYLKDWLRGWCEAHPATDIVRFTSLFYNFAWIWGSDARNRNLFTDWASYDFTVSPMALSRFAEQYGYALTAEDFVNQGLYCATHGIPSAKKRDWMEFTHGLVLAFGRELVDIVHAYGKLAYVFYDDSWVGMEPYSGRFDGFSFDGIIKCVFSGFEARLCANVPVKTHEIRLHPYLFPVGLMGAPTFMPGGNPTEDAKKYWRNVRRALLRQPVDRIGLGGYLRLVEAFPDFVEYIESLSEEFRTIKALHGQGAPENFKACVAVLHAWGKLRSWTLSGHLHETDAHDLIHVIESLSGFPVDVRFIDFDDVRDGALSGVDALICAGRKGTAWSGGGLWADDVVEQVTAWVHAGGAFIGVNEPSALDGFSTALRMAHVLGVDIDMGQLSCHGVWQYEPFRPEWAQIEGVEIPGKPNVILTDGKADVLIEECGAPALTQNAFGKGMGVYWSGYRHSAPNARLLLSIILSAAGFPQGPGIPDNPYVDSAWYPAARALALVNNSEMRREGSVLIEEKAIEFALAPYEMRVLAL